MNAAGKLPLRSARFWVITVAAVAGMGITASLGQWQLGRAAEKLALQAATDQQRDAPVLDGRSLVAGADLQALLQAAVRGEITVRNGEAAVVDPAVLGVAVGQLLSEALQRFERLGLLAA